MRSSASATNATIAKSAVAAGAPSDAAKAVPTARMHEFNYFHPNWHPYYQGRDVHTLQSVTKSVAATVIGIALGRGAIGARSALSAFFQDRDLSRVDPRLRRRRSTTSHHAFGHRVARDGPSARRDQHDVAARASKDWIPFTLSQPMDAEPGTKWVYNSGGSQLLAGIVRKGHGSVHRRVRQ